MHNRLTDRNTMLDDYSEKPRRMAVKRLAGFLIVALMVILSIGLPVTVKAGTPVGTRYVTLGGTDTGDCSSSTSTCRTPAYAVTQAVAGDTIQIAAGTFSNTNISTNKNLTFQGAGMNATILDGGNLGVVFTQTTPSVTIMDLTIQHGNTGGYAGGILVDGAYTLILTRVKITANTGVFGGGIFSRNATLTLMDSIISNNTAATNAGAAYIQNGTVTFSRVTINGNISPSTGGLYTTNATLSLTNVTIHGNSATSLDAGGLSLNGGNTTILNSTITSNTSQTDAGISAAGSGSINFKNTIIAGNLNNSQIVPTDKINDCRISNPAGWTWTSLGNNLERYSTCGFNQSGDIQNTDPFPWMGPLQDNGGPTPTRALLPGSPAINAGTNTGCPATDQRGITRPYGTACDIGAYELKEVPAVFSKTSPVNNATGQLRNPTLTWGISNGTVNYYYCYYTSGGSCSWVDKGTLTSVTLGEQLTPGGEYFWQAKAVNPDGTTYANGSESATWAFTVRPLPGTFNKTGPADAAVNQPADLNLSWQASSETEQYQYCIDMTSGTDCESVWLSNGTSTTLALSDLTPGTYYWHVRSANSSGATYANGNTWWSFTVPAAPGSFGKKTPANGAKNLPAALTLKWAASSDAVEYVYCYDKTNDGECGIGWKSAGTGLSAAITGLAKTTYYWQVRAKNANGDITANGSTWWSFTVPPKPGSFGKTSPATNSINKPTTLTLYWAASTNAAKYEYCIKKLMSATCTWKSTGTVRNVKLTGLLKNQKYYWQVRAKNVNGTTIANGGIWWNFKTGP